MLCGCDVLANADDPSDPPPPSWVQTRPYPEIRDLADVVMLPGGLGFAVGSDGAVVRIQQGAFTLENSGTTEDLQGVSAFVDAEGEPLVLACGANGAVVLRRAGAWSVLPTGATTFLFSTWLRNETDGFVVGDSGTVYRFDGAALTLMDQQTLQPVPITDALGNPSTGYFPISDALKGVAGAGGNVWAVGAGGAVFRFDAGAPPADLSNTWQQEDSTTQRPLVSLFSRAGLWAPTRDGVVVRSGGDGGWNDDFLAPVPVFLQDVFVGDGEGVFLVGLVDRIYHRRSDDNVWQQVVLEPEMFMRAVDGAIAPSDVEDEPDRMLVVAVGAGGRIVRGPEVLQDPTDERLELEEIEPIQ